MGLWPLANCFIYVDMGLIPCTKWVSNLEKKSTMRKAKLFVVLIFFVSVFVSACLDLEHKGQGNDIPTKGELSIAFDVNDSLMFAQLIDRFQELYPQTHITPLFMPPYQILAAVRDKKIHAMFFNYQYDTQTIKELESRNIKVRFHALAETSTAFIVHKRNPNNRLSSDTLSRILLGEQIGWKGLSIPLECVFLKNDLAFNNFTDWMRKQGKYGSKVLRIKRVIQCDNPLAIFAYVQSHPGALGFVGLNWIADRGDTLAKHLRHSVKVLAVENDKTHEFHLPYQSQVCAKQYPFVSPVMGYDLQGYNGLAAGFLSFCCDQGGQIIIKKCGLSPISPPARTIRLEN